MMTEFGDKIDDILNKVGATSVPQHVAKGVQRHRDTDYDQLHKDLHNEAKHLKADYLQEVIEFARFMRARQGSMPYAPPVDERPSDLPLGPCTTWTRDKQPEGFQGKKHNPLPLGSSGIKSATIIEAIVETLPFMTLVAIADVLQIPHNYTEWLDDEFPDKEDKLRVAVAESMKKVGK